MSLSYWGALYLGSCGHRSCVLSFVPPVIAAWFAHSFSQLIPTCSCCVVWTEQSAQLPILRKRLQRRLKDLAPCSPAVSPDILVVPRKDWGVVAIITCLPVSEERGRKFKNNEQLSPEYSSLLKAKFVFVWQRLGLAQSTGCMNADIYPWGLLGSLCVRDGDEKWLTASPRCHSKGSAARVKM